MKHLDVILGKMFSIVKADYRLFENKPLWFHKYSWTEEEQNKFEKWLIEYMKTHSEARKELMTIKSIKMVPKFVNEFIFNYGWKLELKKNEHK